MEEVELEPCICGCKGCIYEEDPECPGYSDEDFCKDDDGTQCIVVAKN